MRSSELPDRSVPSQSDVEQRIPADLMKATLKGDPVAVYQCVLHCQKHDAALPNWLVDHLLTLISDYHLGMKPSWRGKGNRPINVVRRRFEIEVMRRAVHGVRAWVADKNDYQGMPTLCISEWNEQVEWFHKDIKTIEAVFEFASFGLKGVQMQDNGPTIKASARTLRRVMSKEATLPKLPFVGRIAEVFGLQNPDDIFGFDGKLNPNLK